MEPCFQGRQAGGGLSPAWEGLRHYFKGDCNRSLLIVYCWSLRSLSNC